MTLYFVDGEGRYLGGFDGAEPPEGAIEVPEPPSHASHIWSGTAFLPPALTEEQAREAYKVTRAALVAAIVVDVDGLPFDGDEISQGRMSRAIQALQIAAAPSTLWVLANNTPTMVTLAQFQQALVAAGQAQSALWVGP